MSQSSVQDTTIPPARGAVVAAGPRRHGGHSARLLRAAKAKSDALPLVAIIAVAAALRFSTLGLQSFDADEGFTVHLVRMPLGDMLSQLPRVESMPPLHYVLVWVWAQIFGTHEAGLRSFSALCGTLTIPVLYSLGCAAFSRRAGLVAAAIGAVSPVLVWYSQEARPYALLALFSALALHYFVRATSEPSVRVLTSWAIAAALSIASHYFAVFLVLPEAIWLVWRSGRRRRVLLACACPAVITAALAPLAWAQRHPPGGWFVKFKAPIASSLGERVTHLPRELLLGFKEPAGKVLAAALVALALYALGSLIRAKDRTVRRNSLTIATVAACAFVVPIIAAAITPQLDFIDTRNFIAAWVPVLVLIAAGLATVRGSSVAVGAFAAISAAMVIAVFSNAAYQRPDVRGAVATLGPPRTARMVLFTGGPGLLVQDYLPLSSTSVPAARIGEIDVIAMPVAGATRAPSLSAVGAPSPAFALTERIHHESFTVLRFVSATPQQVSASSLLPQYWKGWTQADLGPGAEMGVVAQFPPGYFDG